MAFIQCWRWFGPADPIALREIRQTGASGIVTALHEVPAGEVWTLEAIRARQEMVRSEGLEWVVAESLPVHEEIKRGGAHASRYLESYRASLVYQFITRDRGELHPGEGFYDEFYLRDGAYQAISGFPTVVDGIAIRGRRDGLQWLRFPGCDRRNSEDKDRATRGAFRRAVRMVVLDCGAMFDLDVTAAETLEEAFLPSERDIERAARARVSL